MSAPIEDRLAIEDLLVSYCTAVDARTDPAAVAATYWTEDGVHDNTAIGSPLVTGQQALTENFARMFAAMELLEHRLSGFHVTTDEDDCAQGGAAVTASGRPSGGATFQTHGLYRLEARRTDGVWKLARLTFTPGE